MDIDFNDPLSLARHGDTLAGILINEKRQTLTRLVAVLVNKGLMSAAQRNAMGVQTNAEFAATLAKSIVDAAKHALVPEGQQVFTPPSPSPTAHVFPPPAPAAPTDADSVASVAPAPAPAAPAAPAEAPRRRRAAAAAEPAAAGGASSEQFAEVVAEVHKMSAAVASCVATVNETKSVLFTDTQALRRENEELKKRLADMEEMQKATMGAIAELGAEVRRSMRLTLASCEMAADAPPAQVVEQANLEYIGTALQGLQVG